MTVMALTIVGMLDVLFVAERILTSILLLLSAYLALRLLSYYKGGMLAKPWPPLFAGIFMFAIAQPISAVAGVYESDFLRVVAAALSLVGSFSIFFGLFRVVREWSALRKSVGA